MSFFKSKYTGEEIEALLDKINSSPTNVANGHDIIITNYTEYPNNVNLQIGYNKSDSYSEQYITVQPDQTEQINGVTAFSINYSSCRFLINGAFIKYNNDNISIVRGGNTTITANGLVTIIPLSKIGITVTDANLD